VSQYEKTALGKGGEAVGWKRFRAVTFRGKLFPKKKASNDAGSIDPFPLPRPKTCVLWFSSRSASKDFILSDFPDGNNRIRNIQFRLFKHYRTRV
jgi:hypothetical protein